MPIVFAEPDYYFKVQDSPNINLVCINNDVVCNSCNITAFDPRGKVLLNNVAMTNNVSYFTRQLTGLTILGDYHSTATCVQGTKLYTYNITFEVNNIGKKIENLLPIVLFLTLMILSTLWMLGIAATAKNVMMYPIMLLASLLFMFFFFILYMHTIGLSRLFYVLYWIFTIISVGVFFLILWEVTLVYVTNWSKKGRERKQFKDNF